MNLTGKPSVDKPWLQFYPEQLRNVEVPKMTIEELPDYCLWNCCDKSS